MASCIFGVCGRAAFGSKSFRNSIFGLFGNNSYQKGEWSSDSAHLGHVRFNQTSNFREKDQPIQFKESLQIVANARIDEKDELLAKLRSNGCEVSEESDDTDLIVNAYSVWGEECTKYLLGDYVFAIWDERIKKLFLARDRFGLQVIYYAHLKDSFIFSNSIMAIRTFSDRFEELDHPSEQAIGDFLLFGNIRWLDKSLTSFEYIKSLIPAHSLTYTNLDGINIKPYWDFPMDVPLLRYKREEDYADHFKEVMKSALKDRLRTKKVCVLMSGGLDSTTIAALSSGLIKEGKVNAEIHAFTADSEDNASSRETHYAGLVAEKLNIPITYLIYKNKRILSPDIPCSELGLNLFPSETAQTIRQINSISRVSLLGGAGDNLISYPCKALHNMFREMNFIDVVKRINACGSWNDLFKGIKEAAVLNKGKLLEKDAINDKRYPDWLDPEFEKRYHLKERFVSLKNLWERRGLTPINRRHPASHADMVMASWCDGLGVDALVGQNLEFADMWDPYTDLRVVKFILSLPPLPWLKNKYILRRAMKSYLPDEVLNRPKTADMEKGACKQVKKETDNRLDTWPVHPGLKKYVRREAIPQISGGKPSSWEMYKSFYPLMLNRWLNNLDNREF